MRRGFDVRARLALVLLTIACEAPQDGPAPGMLTFAKEGDAVVATPLDVAKLAAVVQISGDLLFRPVVELGSIKLPQVAGVAGSIRIEQLPDGPAPLVIELPALARVGVDLAARNTSRKIELRLAALTRLGGHLVVEHATGLAVHAARLELVNGDLRIEEGGVAALDLPALARIGGSVRLERFALGGEGPDGGAPDAAASDTAADLVLAFPALTRIDGSVQLRAGPSLDLSAPRLTGIAGDLALEGQRAALHLPALETLDGDLRASASVIPAADLGALRAVGGDVHLDDVTLSGALPLPALASVNGRLEISEAGNLGALDLPALGRVGGRIRVASDGDLRRLSLAALATLGSDLEISGCGADLGVALPALTHLGGSLLFIDDGNLRVSAPRLHEVVGAVRVRRSVLAALDLGLLDSVGQDLEIAGVIGSALPLLRLPGLRATGGSVLFASNQNIAALSLPALARVGGVYDGTPLGGLTVTSNDGLATLELPALARVATDLVVRGNPALDSTSVATATALTAVGGMRSICGNRNGLPLCPPK
jgi:hypothetical protein